MSVPRGFYETLDNCDEAAPAFIRGVLIDQAQYNAMSSQQRMDLEMVPRWTLYGGPFSTRATANEWDQWMFFWANAQGKIWLGQGTPCIVSSYQLKWPADSSFQWTWTWEPENPRRVTKVWNSSKNQNEWKWV